jgi:hypothetical protein
MVRLRILIKNLLKVDRLLVVSRAQLVLFKVNMMSYKRHQNLELQFDALWSNNSKKSSDPEAPQASTSKGCKRCYNLNLDALCAQSQHSNVE